MQHSARSPSRAMFGATVLLAACGSALPSMAMAQLAAPPTPNGSVEPVKRAVPNTVKYRALTADEKAAIARATGLAAHENAGGQKIALKVENASLSEIATRVEAALPKAVQQAVTIEVRGTSPSRFTFDVADAMAGNILQSASNLADFKCLVFSDRFLLSPDALLTDDERKDGHDWFGSIAAGGSQWSARSKAKSTLIGTIANVLEEAVGANEGATDWQTTLGALSPEVQGMVQRLAALGTTGVPYTPYPIDAEFGFELRPDHVGLDLIVRASTTSSSLARAISIGSSR